MKRFLILIVVLCLLIPSTVVLASDITGAEYQTSITVTNNSSSTQTLNLVTLDLSTPDMITNGMIAATADDIAMHRPGAVDVGVMPGANATNPWIFYVPTISGLSQSSYYLYTGGVTGGKVVYFPDTAGMEIDDDATIEPGDNFSITASGFFNAGTITTSMLSYTEELLPDGVGDATGLNPNPAPNWDAVNENYATPSDADYVFINGGSGTDYYTLQNTSIPSGATVDNVTIYFRIYSAAGGTVTPILRLSGSNTVGSGTACTTSFATHSQTLARPGGGNWTVSDINLLQAGVTLTVSVNPVQCSQVSVVVAWHIELSTDITAGEHTITGQSDGTDFNLIVDTVTENTTATGGASINNNANNWYVAENITSVNKTSAFTMTGKMLYLEYFEIKVDGVQKCYIDWDYGATFTDQSGNSNDATPTFRTTANNNYVSATITSQTSTAGQGEPEALATSGFVMIDSVPTSPGNLFDEGGTTFPGAAEITTFADESRAMSTEGWFYLIAFITAGMAGIAVYAGTHRAKMGIRGSLLLMCLTIEIVLCIWVFGGGGVISGFVLIPFGLLSILFMMIRNPQSPVVN